MNEGVTISDLQISHIQKQAKYMVREAVGTHGNAAGAIIVVVNRVNREQVGRLRCCVVALLLRCRPLHIADGELITAPFDCLAPGWQAGIGTQPKFVFLEFFARPSWPTLCFASISFHASVWLSINCAS